MTVWTVTRFVVICDRCQVPAGGGGVEAQWESRAAAIAEVCGPRWGWVATADGQLCDRCVAVLNCLTQGHDWGPWQPLPAARDPDGEDLRVRVCTGCGRDEVADVERQAIGPTGGSVLASGAA